MKIDGRHTVLLYDQSWPRWGPDEYRLCVHRFQLIESFVLTMILGTLYPIGCLILNTQCFHEKRSE